MLAGRWGEAKESLFRPRDFRILLGWARGVSDAGQNWRCEKEGAVLGKAGGWGPGQAEVLALERGGGSRGEGERGGGNPCLVGSFRFFFFFNVDHFKSLYWICYNIASVLCFVSLAMRHVGSELPPPPRAKLAHPALEGEVWITAPPRKSVPWDLFSKERKDT